MNKILKAYALGVTALLLMALRTEYHPIFAGTVGAYNTRSYPVSTALDGGAGKFQVAVQGTWPAVNAMSEQSNHILLFDVASAAEANFKLHCLTPYVPAFASARDLPIYDAGFD